MRREYERVRCPLCKRQISAYVPHMGDGSDIKIIPHNHYAHSNGGARCAASGRLLGELVAALGAK